MPTFIDESGDAGVAEGTTPYFRLAAVWFENEDDIAEYLKVVTEVKSKNGLAQAFEFHYAKIDTQEKKVYFDAIISCRFNFVFCELRKPTFRRGLLSKNEILRSVVGSVACHFDEWYRIAEACACRQAGLHEPIIYDQCEDPGYVKILETRFRSLGVGRESRGKLIGHIKPGKSANDPCIQLADMICGEVGRHGDGGSNHFGQIARKAIRIDVLEGK